MIMAPFEWILLVVIGAVLGTVASFFFSTMSEKIRMPPSLCLTLGILGALMGGAIAFITPIAVFGRWTFYAFGVLLAVGLLTGGVLDYVLTSEEERV
jgi:uncharacterized membrane protein YeaQ/YmgE (transglycosylase-associated protein family)